MNWYKRYKTASSGYGCWIGTSGEEFPVPEYGNHGRLGEIILKEKHGMDNVENPWMEMLKIGYIRVVYNPLGINAEVKITHAQRNTLSRIIRETESYNISFDAPVARSYETVSDSLSALEILRKM